MEITRKSEFSGKVNTMDLDVTQAQIDAWQGGELIQNAMPNLNPDEREFLMTGATPQEWEDMFGSPTATFDDMVDRSGPADIGWNKAFFSDDEEDGTG